MVERRVGQSRGEFESVGEYVEFVLREVVGGEGRHVYTAEEEEEIKKRLRGLGYL